MYICNIVDNLTCNHIFSKNSVTFIIGLLALLTPIYGYARESPVNRQQSPQARALTISALQDIKDNDWAAARVKFGQSRDPLASKIYHWLLLTNTDKSEWTNELFIKLSRFIQNNPEWPSVSKMKLRAEGVMPEDLSNSEVIAWYNDFPPTTPYGTGRYIDALIIDGKKEKVQEFIAGWWSNNSISRDGQRKFFKKYGNYLTVAAHFKRFDVLLHNRDYENALAIANVLGQGYPALAKARIALSKNRGSGLAKLIDKIPSYLQDDPGLLYERLKWRRKRNLDSGAIDILLNTPDDVVIHNRSAWWKERHIIIRRLLEKGEFDKAYDVANNHIQKDGFSYAQAQWLTGWLALRFMDKPEQAYERFTALYQKVKTPVSKARASYWAGVTAQNLDMQDLSKGWYEKAAEFQTVFYGQMAGAALSRGRELPKSSYTFLSETERDSYQKNELIQAYEIFDEAGATDKSEAFLYSFLYDEATPKAYKFAAEMVSAKGNYYGAVKIAKKAKIKGFLLTKQSYPTITKYLADMDTVEWALVHALIRQESMFDPKAKSHAGARGLMQLMPATAREVSKKIGVGYRRSWLTSKPKYNILVGGSYIGQLLDRYDGSYPLAIAAYNAGPSRVNTWLSMFGDPRTGEVDPIDWIELIPIYETRNYVQRVMEGVYIYRLRLKRVQQKPTEKLHVAFYSKD